jgi:hypothetical protein
MVAADREWAGAIGYRFCGAGGVTDAYVCRLLPLTCLAPDIVEAFLDRRQPKGLRLVEMLGNGPLDWGEQRGKWSFLLYGAILLVVRIRLVVAPVLQVG